MKSMTGFGKANGALKHANFTIEINSVNRRNLECSFSLPREWQALERTCAELIRKRVKRGKIHTSIRIEGATSQTQLLCWDETGLAQSLEALRQQAVRAGIVWQPDSSLLLQLALLHRSNDSDGKELEAIQESIVKVLEMAIQQLDEMRSQEGSALATDLLQRAQIIRNACSDIATLSREASTQYRQQLLTRLKASGIELDLNDERLLKELALFADKADIAEELTRLDSHLQQFCAVVSSDEDLMGRKLEFILQEIHREVNTIGSKTSQVEVTRLVIDCKNEIERIREQVQNIE